MNPPRNKALPPRLAAKDQSNRYQRECHEDQRLFALIKHVEREDDRDKTKQSLQKLKDYISNPEYNRIVVKQSESIYNRLQELFYQRVPNDVKREVADTLGILGWVLAHDAERFFTWNYNCILGAPSDDVKVFYLLALRRAVEVDLQFNSVFGSMIDGLMSKLQAVLERAEDPDLLQGVVDAILVIALHYPGAFEQHFENTVDILIGWHIDPLQSYKLVKFTSNVLLKLHDFWILDYHYSLKLIRQFLEDIEAYKEDITGEARAFDEEEPMSLTASISKVESLLSVLGVVVEALADLRSIPDAINLVYKNIERITNTVYAISEIHISPSLVSRASRTLCQLIDCIASSMNVPAEQLIKFALDVLALDTRLSEQTLVACFTLIQKIVESVQGQIDAGLLEVLFSPSSLIRKMRFCSDEQVAESCLKIYQTALVVKDIPVLESVYRMFVLELEESINYLLRDVRLEDDSVIRRFVNLSLHDEMEPRTSVGGFNSPAEAEQTAIFLLTTFSSLCSQKSSLIVNYALKPSLFHLFCDELKVVYTRLNENYAALQYTLLYVLYLHSSSNGHFISTCLATLEGLGIDPFPSAPSRSNHLLKILNLLTTLLQRSDTPFDSRRHCLTWFSEILKVLVESPNERVLETPQFKSTVAALFACATHTVILPTHQKVCSCLQALLPLCRSENELRKIAQLCIIMQNHSDSDISVIYRDVLVNLPITSLVSEPPGASNNPLLAEEKKAKSLVMQKSPSLYFSAQDFKSVMNIVLTDEETHHDMDFDWLERLFYKNQRKGDKHPFPPVMDRQIRMGHVAWFTALWDCSSYCISSKLRTPLGKAQDTFTLIEGVLRNYAVAILSKHPTRCSELDLSTEALLGYEKHMLLLNFLNCLEKQLYNAVEGSAVVLPSINKNIKMFFRTNRSTCSSWLSRIRLPAMLLAIQCRLPAHTLYHGYQYLAEINDTTGNDFIEAILLICQALLLTNDVDALIGFSTWINQKTGKAANWMRPMIEHARGNYETAFSEYASLFNDSSSQMSLPIARVIYDQTTQIAFGVGMLHELEGFVESIATHSSFSSLQKLTEHQLLHARSLKHFDDLDFVSCKRNISSLLQQDICTQEQPSAPAAIFCFGLPWCPADLLSSLQIALIQTACDASLSHKMGASFSIDEVRHYTDAVIHPTQQAAQWLLCNARPHRCQALSLMNFSNVISSLLRNEAYNFPETAADCKLSSLELQNLAGMQSQLRMLNLCSHLSFPSKEATLPRVFSLRLLMARLYRKLGCLKLAYSTLNTQLGSLDDSSPQALQSAIQIFSETAVVNKESIAVKREVAKLLYVSSYENEALEEMSSTVLFSLRDYPSLSSHCMVSIIKWLNTDSKLHSILVRPTPTSDSDAYTYPNLRHLIALSRNSEELQAMKYDSQVLVLDELSGFNSLDVIPETDFVIGSFSQLSAILCPTEAKAWWHFGSWAYKWGRKIVDQISNSGCVSLLEEEKETVLGLLGDSFSEEQIDAIISVLGQTHFSNFHDEEITELDNLRDEAVEVVRKQLFTTCPYLATIDDKIVADLISVWSSLCHRIFSLYQISAQAYFRFLQLNLNASNEDSNTTATLRILRLLVKHAWELKETLESGLEHTSTQPWRGICPQLFSRLNHPEPYVRKSVADLLSRLARDSPHLVVYPVVVGFRTRLSERRIKDKSEALKRMMSSDDELQASKEEDVIEIDTEMRSLDDDEDAEAEEDNEEETLAEAEAGYASLVDTLSNHDLALVVDVKLFVSELRRVSVLWDELWLAALQHYTTEMNRCAHQMECETKKLERNKKLTTVERSAILKARFTACLKPILFVFQQLHELTSTAAETPHEEWFRTTFNTAIEEALDSIKDPTNLKRPQDVWLHFHRLTEALEQRAGKKSNFQLEMKNITPRLASMRDTAIPLPISGISEVITMRSFFNHVSIMPTKTKPKKFSLVGSDGKTYTYLFKGLEDLHLDERIMQFLTIANNMFSRTGLAAQARNYAVTPLGVRSGLIQWVDGAAPLFSLYKRWQLRESIAQAVRAQASQINQTGDKLDANLVVPPIQRPSELFYSKIHPALKERGLAEDCNRRDWPLAVLRSVVSELVLETPGNLLAKELWCSSNSPEDWWQMTQQFNGCAALTSVVGYVIGLGDRHLDNILVDLKTGEIVHIDYNVCFEKGKSLRVPEKVPFRMTQNIQKALGVTGVEGIFRQSCEHVMRVLRKGRETLLTLLEAFVYDPLVDWTTTSEFGFIGVLQFAKKSIDELKAAKRQMEHEISQDLLAAKMLETRVPWQNNMEAILNGFNPLPEALQLLLSQDNTLKDVELSLSSLEDQRLYLESAGSGLDHPFWMLIQRKNEVYSFNSAAEKLEQEVSDLKNEAFGWISNLQKLFRDYCDGTLNDMFVDRTTILPQMPCIIAYQFLSTVGQMQQVNQCEALQGELKQAIQQNSQQYINAAKALHSYMAIAALLPLKSSLKHHMALFYTEALKKPVSVEQLQSLEKNIVEQMKVSDEQLSTIDLIQTFLTTCISNENQNLLHLQTRLSALGTIPVPIQEHEAKIKQFVDGHSLRRKSMTVVIMSGLATLCKQYCLMEEAAFRASVSLRKLRSPDGDWFLDEISLLSSNVCQLVGILLNYADFTRSTQLKADVDALYLVFNIYANIQDFYYNIVSIVIPEAVKIIMSGKEDEVFNTLMALYSRLLDAQGNLSSGIPEPKFIEEIRRLMSEWSQKSLLFAAFSFLFSALEKQGIEFIEKVQLSISPVADLDLFVSSVKTARSFQFLKAGESESLFSDLFLVESLIAVVDVFVLATCYVSTLTGSPQSMPSRLSGYVTDKFVTINDLAAPVQNFISQFVLQRVIGHPSLVLNHVILRCFSGVDLAGLVQDSLDQGGSSVPLDSIVKSAVESHLAETIVSPHEDYNDLSNLVRENESIFRQLAKIRNVEKQLALVKTKMQLLQLHVIVFQWSHQNELLKQGNVEFLQLTKHQALTDIKQQMKSVTAKKSALQSKIDAYESLCDSIEQRLKWAAGGNQTLKVTLEDFIKNRKDLHEFLMTENHRMDVLVQSGNLVISYEDMLQLESAVVHPLLQSMKSIVERFAHIESFDRVTLTETEKQLLNTHQDSLEVTEEWRVKNIKQLEKSYKTLRLGLSDGKKLLGTYRDSLKHYLQPVKAALATHQKLISEVKTMMKAIAREDEVTETSVNIPTNQMTKNIKQYVFCYRHFSDMLTFLLRSLHNITNDVTTLRSLDDGGTKLSQTLKTVIEYIPRIYDSLLALATPLLNNVENDSSFAAAVSGITKLASIKELKITETPVASAQVITKSQRSTQLKRDPRTGKAIQERNNYAIAVWRRVKAKLDGKDIDPTRRYTVQDQVDYIIKEAIDDDNLAQMYEGWTSWV